MAEEFNNNSQTYDEYGCPKDVLSLAKEEADTGHEYEPPKDEEYVNKKSKAGKRFLQRHGVMIMQTAAAVLAVVVVKDAFGYDVLAGDPFNDAFENYHMEYVLDGNDSAKDKPVPERTDKKETEPKKTEKDEKPETLITDEADDAFPTLGNLSPNGEVPGYGVLNEQYIMMENGVDEHTYIYHTVEKFMIDDDGLHLENGEVLANFYYDPDATIEDMYNFPYVERYPSMTWSQTAGLVAYKNFVATGDGSVAQPIMIREISNESIPGAYYDEATNTLTLDNYSGDFLNVNLMGNGFKLKLVGDNELTGILVWGFMYGGSLTITGDGKLTINHSSMPGIRLECENSASCLMIDSNVTIEISEGTNAAIVVYDTTLPKGIYYLKPLEVKSKAGENLIRSGLTEVAERQCLTFTDSKSKYATSMRIAPKEDK